MLAKKCFLLGIITLLSVSLAIADPPAVHPTTGEPLVIDCLRGTPDAIDGDLSDWNLEAMTPAVLDVVEQLNSGQDSWDGPEDSSGEFYLLWDDENIYIAAVVKDEKLSMNKTGGDIWNADAVEVFFSTLNAVAGHDEHYQYGFNANNQRWNWCNMDGAGSTEPDYLQIASSVTADGYICEASIPYGQMPSLDFSAGNTIGFHPVFDDTDNGDTELQMSWTGLAAHDQSLGFGHMFLSAEPPAAPALPEGWQSQDIGTTGGSAAESDGTWVISADGADVWDNSDQFHYAYVPLSGDGEIVARVVDNGTGSNAWAKGGVMIRETLDADSKHSLMALTGSEGGGITFQGRPVTSERSNSMHGDITASPPYWVKLTREDNTITAYSSADGVDWVLFTDTSPDGAQTNPIDVEMAADVYIGLFVTSHASGEIRTYTFDNVSLALPVGWQSQDIDTTGGSAAESDGTWVISADGADIWGNSDQFHYVYTELTGDATIEARVVDNGEGSNAWAKGGVMIRQSLDADSINVSGFITGGSGDGGQFQWRPVQGESSSSNRTLTGIAPPYYVRLVREGNTFTVYMSADGVDWAQQGEPPATIEMTDPVLIGLAVTSHQDGEVRTFTFDNVRVILHDVTAPGDIVKGVPDEPRDGSVAGWPDGEFPWLAVDDDVSTKFLHFRGEVSPTGFVIKPASGASIVTGLTFTTANDAPERDPVAFELSGSNVGIDGPYELIASGDIVDFAQEAEWPRFTMNTTPISFDNDVAYAHYQVLFPAVRDPASANSMQIAEVELLGFPPAGPVGHWKLDDGEGIIAVDSSGNGNDGILIGTAMSWMPDDGMIGGALSFDGTASDADYVEISTADISLAAGTIAMWGKLSPDPQLPATRYFCGHTTIPAWSSRIQLYMDNSDTILDLGLGDSHARHQDIMSLTTETWYHVALTWDGGNYVVYVNGEEKANGSYAGLDSLNPVADIGNDGNTDGRTEAFNGLLDDVRIYDRALSADEMSQLASPPPYVYDGDALDDTWNHDNGSDAWDDTAPGEGNPGGAAALTEDGVTFLRIQDIGDPRSLGIEDPSNRKVYFQRPMDISLDGARLEFRIRIATSAPLDDQVTGEPWPAEGIGYHIRDNGKGMIGIGEAGEAGVGIISFSLAQAGEPDFADVATDVLVMNNLVGTEASGDVDTGDAAAAVAMNMIAIDDATQWNTFTIDIAAGGAGTHIVTVSANGGPAESFDVTIGTDLENDTSSLLIGSSGTGGVTAFDVDYVSVQ